MIQSIIGAPSETARLWPACISAASRRASESSARPRTKFDSAGAASDVAITSSASTRISSTSVKPEIILILLLILVLKFEDENDDEDEDENFMQLQRSF